MSQKKQRTGRPTSTSQEEILLAAEQLLQEGGETALSFRRLATKLGLSAPSIYTYFPSKQALLKALTDSTINLDFSTEQNLTPAKALSHLLTQLRQRLHEKQHLMGLFNQAMPAASMIQLIEQLADIIEKTGIEHGVALRYGQSLLWMVLGFVLFENSSRNEDVRIPFTDIPEYADTLAHLDVEQHERLWQETLERNLLFLEIRGNKYATQ
jgi:TetR/AcrR family transcriptional regulator, tetracycline repressor protein